MTPRTFIAVGMALILGGCAGAPGAASRPAPSLDLRPLLSTGWTPPTGVPCGVFGEDRLLSLRIDINIPHRQGAGAWPWTA